MDKNLIRNAGLSVGLIGIFFMTQNAAAQELTGADFVTTGADRSYSYGFEQEREVRAFEQAIIQREEEEAAGYQPEAEPAELDVSRFRFFPSFTFGSVYESNINFRHADPDDESLFVYAPRLYVVRGKPGRTKTYFQALASWAFVDYVENDKLSRFNQSYPVAFGWRGEKLSVTVTDRFSPLSSRYIGERTELSSGGTSRAISTVNDASVKLDYALTPKTSAGLEYRHSITYFPSSSNSGNPDIERFSFQANTLSPSFTYRINSKNQISVDASASVDDYFNGGGFSSRKYSLGASYWRQLAPKTNVLIFGGYEWRDYLLDAIPGSEGPRYGAILQHQLTPKVGLSLAMTQSQHQVFDFVQFTREAESFDSESTNLLARAVWAMSPHMTLETFFGITFEDRDRQYSIPDPETGVLETGPMEDEVYRSGLDWNWRPNGPWNYAVSYEYLQKCSSFKALEYEDHRLGGSVRKTF